MLDENWRKFIEEEKRKYNIIGQISCPAFPHEKVHFNKHGFKHLIWKGQKARVRTEQKERLALLPLVKSILENTTEISNYKEETLYGSKACFWSLKGTVEEKCLRIVLRKKNDGPLHFFSVMEE